MARRANGAYVQKRERCKVPCRLEKSAEIKLESTLSGTPPLGKGEHAAKLDKHFSKIVSCRVVVEKPQGRHHVGNLYRTTITLTVPHREIVVNREHPHHHSHEDIFVTVSHAFEDAARQLEEYARMRDNELKDHDILPHGVIHKLYLKEGYGFIQGSGGNEIYFHGNSVLDGFENLEIGTEVWFEEEEGEKGSQASTVKIIRKEHAYHRH